MLKKLLSKLIISCSLIFSLVFVSACPQPKTIEKAKEKSAQIATYADTGVNITRELARADVLKTKDAITINNQFRTLARAGIAFDLMIERLEAETKNPTKSQIEQLFKVFSSEVITAFVAVLESMRVMPGVSKYADTIKLLKSAVLIIARAFDRETEIAAKIELAPA